MKRILLLVFIFLLVGCNQGIMNSKSIIKEIETKTFDVIETENGFEPGEFLYSTIERYNSDGLLIEEIKINTEGFVISRVEKEYNRNGNLLGITTYDDDDKPTGVSVFMYEDDMLMRTEHYKREELNRYTTYEYINERDRLKTNYDSEGNIFDTTEEIYESDFKYTFHYHNEKSDSRASFEYLNDEFGNLIKLKTFDEDEKQISETIINYDKYNNRVKTVNDTAVSESTYEYDDAGNYVTSMSHYGGILRRYEERIIEYWK